MTKPQKRVPNYKLQDLIAQRLPFSNYNASITATLDEKGIYSLTHWRTTIAQLDTNSEEVLYLDFGYYSQTTSALQGRIIRTLPRVYLESLWGQFLKSGDTRSVRRLRGMARIH